MTFRFLNVSRARALGIAAACAIIAVASFATPLTAAGEAADEDVAARVRQCFEGPAAQAFAGAKAADDFTRQLAEMAAGKVCEPLAEEVVNACVAAVDAAGDQEDGSRDYYPCIGIVANPCINSAWASNEFRSVVCAGTEEKVWLDRLHASLDRLRAKLEGERRQRLEDMQKAFFAFRNEQCGLVRMLREGREPDLAYGACTTEAAARFAIDLKDMVETLEAAVANDGGSAAPTPATGSGTGDAAPAAEADAAGGALGSKQAPVRADGPAGERAYLARLRCADGAAPAYQRQGSMGYGGYGHIVDLYAVTCAGDERFEIYMDMDFPGFSETRAVPGFTLADE